MKATRRECLRMGALAGAGALLPGCSQVLQRVSARKLPASLALPPGDVEPVARLLNRVGFGPTPGEAARVAGMGLAAYIEEQLRPSGDEGRELSLRLRGIEAIRTSSLHWPGQSAPAPTGVELQDLREDDVLRQLQQAAILRAVYSPWQLQERMADFWGNHFNIYAHKGQGTYFKPVDELMVVRRHALGTFPDMVRASAHSPAMLEYLDNQQNARGVPNENYARELLELHTLGVHGGYTQKDVLEVARCLTGWTVEDRFLRRRGTFLFDASRHDEGEKTVLGHRIPAGGGQSDGERVLDIVTMHPATARYIGGKLAHHFLGEPSEAWTSRLAAIYAQTGGDIPAMLRPLLLSDDILHAPPILKRPLDFLASTLRATNADTDGKAAVQEHLGAMGQPLYQWPMPDGYPDKASAWTGSLLARWNFAMALLHGGIGGTTVDVPALHTAIGVAPRALVETVMARRADSAALKPLAQRLQNAVAAVPGEGAHGAFSAQAALLVCSPEFQWR